MRLVLQARTPARRHTCLWTPLERCLCTGPAHAHEEQQQQQQQQQSMSSSTTHQTMHAYCAGVATHHRQTTTKRLSIHTIHCSNASSYISSMAMTHAVMVLDSKAYFSADAQTAAPLPQATFALACTLLQLTSSQLAMMSSNTTPVF